MTKNEAIARMRYRIDTATDIVGKGSGGKAYEDMEIAQAQGCSYKEFLEIEEVSRQSEEYERLMGI